MRDSVETQTFEHGITARIEYDTDVQPPHEDMDMVGRIAYLARSREVLGSEEVSLDRMDEIAEGIRDGSLVGLPVYAYVHGGSTIRTSPFNDPWDSGQTGFVYCTKERAVAECGSAEAALKCLEGEVSTFDDYLRGNVYGYVVEDADGNHLDSCWGFYGLDYCREQAHDAARSFVQERADEIAAQKEAERSEAGEVQYWAQRDVVTR